MTVAQTRQLVDDGDGEWKKDLGSLISRFRVNRLSSSLLFKRGERQGLLYIMWFGKYTLSWRGEILGSPKGDFLTCRRREQVCCRSFSLSPFRAGRKKSQTDSFSKRGPMNFHGTLEHKIWHDRNRSYSLCGYLREVLGETLSWTRRRRLICTNTSSLSFQVEMPIGPSIEWMETKWETMMRTKKKELSSCTYGKRSYNVFFPFPPGRPHSLQQRRRPVIKKSAPWKYSGSSNTSFGKRAFDTGNDRGRRK